MLPLFQRESVKLLRSAGAASVHDSARFLRSTAVSMKRSPIFCAAGSSGMVFSSCVGTWTLPAAAGGGSTFGLVQTVVTITATTPATRTVPPIQRRRRWKRGEENRAARALMRPEYCSPNAGVPPYVARLTPRPRGPGGLGVEAVGAVGLRAGGHAAAALVARLDLGVQLRAEEEGETGEPEPGEHHDHGRERAPGLVIGAEHRRVDREQARHGEPRDRGDDGARADELPAALLVREVRAEEEDGSERRQQSDDEDRPLCCPPEIGDEGWCADRRAAARLDLPAEDQQ